MSERLWVLLLGWDIKRLYPTTHGLFPLGFLNRQNIFWANEHPHHFHVSYSNGELDGCHIKLWNNCCHFFPALLIIWTCCTRMLYHNCMLLVCWLMLSFMQDGAIPHSANVVHNFLHGIFGSEMTSCHILGGNDWGKVWPFSICYFYLWDLAEKTVCKEIRGFRALIVQLCHTNAEYLFQEVIKTHTCTHNWGGHKSGWWLYWMCSVLKCM